jgi:hypothetical protein
MVRDRGHADSVYGSRELAPKGERICHSVAMEILFLRRAAVRAAVLAALVSASLGVATAPAAAAPRLSITSPTLTPRYTIGTTDFTVRCGDPVALKVAAGAGLKVAVDGARARGGNFGRTIKLKSGQSFGIQVRGRVSHPRQTVRCLPDDFPLWQSQRRGKPQAQWYLMTPDMIPAGIQLPQTGAPYATIANADGVPVWWYRDPAGAPMGAKLIGKDRIAWTYYAEDEPIRVHSLRGKVLQTVRPTSGINNFHEFLPTRDGGFMVLSDHPRNCPAVESECVDLSQWGGPEKASIQDNEIQRFDSKGRLVWSWSTRGKIDPSEGATWINNPTAFERQLEDGTVSYDVFHINSVELDGDGLLISARHLNAIYRLRTKDGSIDWKIGGTNRPESIDLAGDSEPSDPFSGQHDLRRLPDGTFTLFDNAFSTFRLPRAVRLRVTGRTARQLESVSDKRAVFSACCGSARKLSGGNWVISQGGGTSMTAELTAKGAPVLTMTFPGRLFSYRNEPLERGRLSAATLRAAMDSIHPRRPGN